MREAWKINKTHSKQIICQITNKKQVKREMSVTQQTTLA